MHPARLIPPALLLLATSGIGCSRGPAPAAPAAKAATAAKRVDGVETYTLVGVVKSVEPSKSTVQIRHDAIPGFMGAMTMPFHLKDKSLLDDVREGDEVRGELRVERKGGEVSDYDLTDLVVTRPATAPPVTISVSEAPTQGPLKPGEEVPDFAVTAQDGSTLKLSSLRGNVVALTFIYTRCPLPEFCPAMDKKFAAVAAQASAVPGRADRLRLLSVSFDPEHDTPAVLAEHAKTRGAKPPLWTFAVASHQELARVGGMLGLKYGPTAGEYAHNLSTAVIGPDGKLVRLMAGPAWTPAELLKTMYASIAPPKE